VCLVLQKVEKPVLVFVPAAKNAGTGEAKPVFVGLGAVLAGGRIDVDVRVGGERLKTIGHVRTVVLRSDGEELHFCLHSDQKFYTVHGTEIHLHVHLQ